MSKTHNLIDSLLQEMCGDSCGCSGNKIPMSSMPFKMDGEDKYDHHSDSDAYMSKSDLYNIIENAQMLHDMIPDDYPLEDWVEAKITKAADYIRSVFQYLKYEMNREGESIDKGAPVKVFVATDPRTLSMDNVNEKKLCKRGKEAAKAKFDVYPSAYANAYASKVCAGKVKDSKGKKRRDWPKKGK